MASSKSKYKDSKTESVGGKSDGYKTEECLMAEKQENIDKMYNLLAQYERKEINLDEAFKEIDTYFNRGQSEWIKHVDEKAKHDLIEKLKHEFNANQKVLTRNSITAAEVVDNSSALKGIYLTKALDNISKPRRSMLKTNPCIKFKAPSVSDRDTIDEFQTQNQRDAFSNSLEANGWGGKVAVNVATVLAGGGGGYGHESVNKSERETKDNMSSFYFSRVLCSVVPLALWEPKSEDVSLNDDAIQQLFRIQMFLFLNKTDYAKAECKLFFEKFGSHVFLGDIHFGGTYKIETMYKSDSCSNLDLAKNMVKSKHGESVNANKSYFGTVKIGFEASAHTESGSADESGKFEKEEASNVHTTETKIGGPQEVSSIPVWKSGLVSQNRTWRVVDTGELEIGDFKGVWEFVMNQSNIFEAPTDLAKFLHETWSDVTGLTVNDTILNRKILLETGHRLKLKIDEIYSSFELSTNSQDCVSGIKDLYSHVSAILEEGETSIWEKELRENNKLTHILLTLVHSKISPTEDHDIRYYVEKLINFGKNTTFPSKNEIYLWLRQTKEFAGKSRFAIEQCSNIHNFCKAVNTFLKSIRLEKHRNTTEQDKSSKINIKVEFARAVDKLLSCLRENKKVCEYALLFSVLLPMKFEYRYKAFAMDVDEKALSNFVTELEKREQDLFHIDMKENKRRQAWALRNLFSEIEKRPLDNPSEMENAVQDVIHCFKCPPILHFDESINFLLYECPTMDIGSYIENLKSIEKGLSKSAATPEIEWTCFETCNTKTNQALQDASRPMLSRHRTGCIANGKSSSKIPDIIQKLQLNQFYPEKLSVQRALEINENTFETPQELQDIPWAILRKIISVDYNFRETVLSEFLQKPKKEASQGSTKPKPAGIFKRIGRSSDSVHSDCSNPLDMFLAIFICCDAFLKKVLAQKLFACQVAIPLIYKDLANEKLILSLWPIRDIVIATKEGLEESVVKMNSTVVSFMKIGSRVQTSKSKLINEFLRDLNTVHNTFFHRDCPLGVHKRLISDGMVEIAWFLPEKAKKDLQDREQSDDAVPAQIQQPLTILNLRGDAYIHEKQTQALLQSSSIIVLFVNHDDIKHYEDFETNKYKRLLSDIHTSNSQVIIVTDLKLDDSDIELFQSAYMLHMNMDESKTAFVSFYDTVNERDFNRSEIKAMLTECITDALSTASTQNMENISEKLACEFIFDENKDQCIAGKLLAQSLTDNILKIDSTKRKDEILPLQGKDLWQKWTFVQKEKCRSVNQESYKPKNDPAIVMDSLREAQIKSLNSAPDIMAKFVEALVVQRDDDETTLYFLAWLKHFLDDQSRIVIPSLRNKLHDALSLNEPAKTARNSRKTEVENTEMQLVNASFGVEHFFREISQIYEAFTLINTEKKLKMSPNTNLLIQRLPSIAAKILLLGQPLEILDGDAANVPLMWIKAVFKELQHYLGDKKCLSIAVLGIQSSGKSTLLNSMFGLQFAVSAGRCTRGIYIQLIRVNVKSLGFDYAMIIDAEGLRAPEMSGQMVQHDNELATFVIGMSDIVIINIKGETIADMENVLQIVVHEMLRLQQAHDNLQLQQSAVLVHQNVSAQDAQRKLLQGNQTVVNNLDKMTQLAADQERMTGIKSFNDVIAFDSLKHVKYIPDLWHGHPPMAPGSPSYSKESLETARCILKDITETHKNCHTFSQISLLLGSLWNGILAEDFVFSFRNVLEIKAYSLLEEKYQQLKWDLEVEKTTWFNDTFLQELASCNQPGELQDLEYKLIEDFNGKMGTATDKYIENLREFIEASDFSDEMTKWKESKSLRLQDICQDIKQNMKQKMKKHVKQREGVITEEDTLMQKKEQLNVLASMLANKIKESGEEASKKEINEQFSGLWISWVNDIPCEDKTVSKYTLKRDITNTLEDRYSNHAHLITPGLRANPLDKQKFEKGLQNSLNVAIKEDHIDVKSRKLLGYNLWRKSTHKEQIPVAKAAVNGIFNDIENYFDRLLQKDTDYDQGQFSHVLKLVTEQFTSYNKKDSNNIFTMKPTLEIMVALQAARYSYQKLLLLKTTYEGKHSLRAQLLEYKPKAKELFTDIVESKTNEIIASKQLCLELKDIIQEKIELDMHMKIATKIGAHFSHQKHSLIKEIMTDLADKDIFSAYEKYMNSADKYALDYITALTNRIVFDKKDGHGRSYFVTVTEAQVTKIIEVVKEHAAAVTKALDPKHGVSEWIESFRQQIHDQKLIISRGRFRNVINRPVEDFQNFLVCVSDQLSDLEKELVKYFESLSPSTIKWQGETPYERIFDALWGCTETCPFCDEPCQETDKIHTNVPHKCVQHRPVGISGIHYSSSNKLAIESCNYKIKSNATLRCGSWCNCAAPESDKKHPYRQYKTYVPTWDIAPQEDMKSSKYWVWFMAKHYKELAKCHYTNEPDIPEDWRHTSKEEAIKSLSVYSD